MNTDPTTPTENHRKLGRPATTTPYFPPDRDAWLATWRDLITIGAQFHEAMVLQTAVKLDLFTTIPKEGMTAQGIIERLGLDPFRGQLFLNALTGRGLLYLEGERFHVPPELVPFLAEGPQSVANNLKRFHFEAEVWLRLPEILAGKEQPPAEYGEEFFINYAPRYPGLKVFNRIMADAIVTQNADTIKKAKRAIDLGGGDGVFAGGVLTLNPHVAYTLLEVPEGHQCKTDLAEHIESGRLRLALGDARTFESSETYDLAVLNELLELFTKDEKAEIISRVVKTLEPGGTVIAAKFHVDENNIQPRFGSMFSFRMSLMKPGVYLESDEEVAALMREAGCSKVEIQRPFPFKTAVVGTK